jgi:hypothetical protein
MTRLFRSSKGLCKQAHSWLHASKHTLTKATDIYIKTNANIHNNTPTNAQKCRLPAKLQFLGLATALKILLVPENVVPDSISRSEIVAIINTLYLLSSSIKAVPYLFSLLEHKDRVKK